MPSVQSQQSVLIYQALTNATVKMALVEMALTVLVSFIQLYYLIGSVVCLQVMLLLCKHVKHFQDSLESPRGRANVVFTVF